MPQPACVPRRDDCCSLAAGHGGLHGHTPGGPVNTTQVKTLGKEQAQDGLHTPEFQAGGVHEPMVDGAKVGMAAPPP